MIEHGPGKQGYRSPSDLGVEPLTIDLCPELCVVIDRDILQDDGGRPYNLMLAQRSICSKEGMANLLHGLGR